MESAGRLQPRRPRYAKRQDLACPSRHRLRNIVGRCRLGRGGSKRFSADRLPCRRNHLFRPGCVEERRKPGARKVVPHHRLQMQHVASKHDGRHKCFRYPRACRRRQPPQRERLCNAPHRRHLLPELQPGGLAAEILPRQRHRPLRLGRRRGRKRRHLLHEGRVGQRVSLRLQEHQIPKVGSHGRPGSPQPRC